MAVNHVRPLGDLRQVIDDRDRVAADLRGKGPEARTVDDRQVSAPEESDREVPDVELCPGAVRENAVGEQNPQRRISA